MGEVRKSLVAWTARLSAGDESVWSELLKVSIDDKRLMLQALNTEAALGFKGGVARPQAHPEEAKGRFCQILPVGLMRNKDNFLPIVPRWLP